MDRKGVLEIQVHVVHMYKQNTCAEDHIHSFAQPHDGPPTGNLVVYIATPVLQGMSVATGVEAAAMCVNAQ